MPRRRKISPFIKQCFVTSAVGCNIVGHGCVMGFPAILLPQLHQTGSPIPLTKEADSWITSLVGITLIAGSYVSPPIMGRLGRKIAHFTIIMFAMVGWLVTIFATSIEALIIGRIISGISYGMMLTLRSVLIGEFTSPKYRGGFLTTVSLAQTLGIFFVHLVGTQLTWQMTAVVCLFFPFFSLLMTIYIPESPSWLAAKGRYDDCRKVFRWLRGNSEEDELEDLIRARQDINENQMQKKDSKTTLAIIKKKEFFIPIVVMAHAYTMGQFSGGNTMAAYSKQIIELIMGPNVSSDTWMVSIDTLRMSSNILAIYVVNKFNRRTVIFATGGLCILSNLAIAVFVYSRYHGLISEIIWIPAMLLHLQMFSVALGMVPLPIIIAGEIFPLAYRSIAGSISVSIVATAFFVVLKTFLVLIDTLGLPGTYVLYACILSYDIAIIWWLMPETRGRTLQQIEDEFTGRKTLVDANIMEALNHQDDEACDENKLKNLNQ